MTTDSPTDKPKRSPLRLAIAIVLVALGLLGGVSVLMKEGRLLVFGERATGTVREVEEITTSTQATWGRDIKGRSHIVKRSGPAHLVHLTFVTQDGRNIEFATRATFSTETKPGDTHPLIYLPSSPQLAKIASAKQLWLPMCVGMIFTAVCLGAGVCLLYR
jgi:hypothetical protein